MRHLAAVGAATLSVALLATTSALAQSAPEPDKPKKEKATQAGTSATSATRPDTTVSKDAPLRLRAIAVDQNTAAGAANTGTLDIVIERWSSDSEVDQLRSVLEERRGDDALLRAVQKIRPRAGYVRTAHSLGWDIQFAREATTSDGARRIILASDRPMSYWEASARPRSADYEFMLAEIHIGKDGRGQGRLAPAAMVDWDESTRTIEIENFQNLPIRLTDVRIQK